MKGYEILSLLAALSVLACRQDGVVDTRTQALELASVEEPAPEPIEVVGEAGPEPDPGDMDGDGVPAEVDLDDLEETIGAVLPERLCDGIDQDGDGGDACPVDEDADGVRAERDCDDLDARVSPVAREVWCDGVDQNCNGVDDCDRDGDGLRDTDDPEPDIAAAEPAVVVRDEP